MGLTITKEEIAKLPIETFSGKIEVIDDIKYPCVNYLSQNKYYFDTEPTVFKWGQVQLLSCNFREDMFFSVEPYWYRLDELFVIPMPKIGFL